MLHKTILVLSSLLFCVSVYAEEGSEDFFVGREINYNNLSLAAKNTSGSIDKIVKKSNVIFLELKNFYPDFIIKTDENGKSEYIKNRYCNNKIPVIDSDRYEDHFRNAEKYSNVS